MITSAENPKIKYLRKLNTAKYRKKEKKFLVEGKHLVEEARKLGLLEEAFSLEKQEGYTQLSASIMQKLCNTDTTVSEIGLCRWIEREEMKERCIALDAVQDPGNMGALMRSAAAFGFSTVILGEGCVDIYNDKVIRSSQGAIFKLNFIHANLSSFLSELTDYTVLGTDVAFGISLNDMEHTDKIVVVLGNEGNGISPEVRQKIKRNIYIPMQNTESLNVSVAGGIIMYELRRRQ